MAHVTLKNVRKSLYDPKAVQNTYFGYIQRSHLVKIRNSEYNSPLALL